MKKIKRITLWLLSSCFFLAACSPAPEKQESDQQESKQSVETEQTTQREDEQHKENDTSQAEEEKPYLLSLMTNSEYNSVREEGQVLCYTEFQKVWLDTGEETSSDTGALAFPKLAEALEEMNARTGESSDEHIKEMEDVARDMMENSEYFQELSWEEDLWITRADSQIMSVLKMEYSYSGGAHGYYAYTGATFDSKSGRQVELKEIVADSRRLVELAADRLVEKYPDIQFFEPPKEVLLKELEEGHLTWTVGYDGITFYFSPYELAAYADGAQMVTILYKEEPELFGTRICQVPRAWAVRLAPGAEYDLGQDGTRDTLEAWGGFGEMGDVYDSFTISVNGQERVQKDMWFYGYTPYLVHSEALNTELLVIETVAENDYEVLTVYEVDPDGTGFLTPWEFSSTGFFYYLEEKEDGFYEFGDEVFSNPEHFRLITRLNLLSTYSGVRWYGLWEEAKGEGYLRPEEPWYEVDKREEPLTLLVPIEMEVGDGNETEEFPAGTKLWIVRTDGEYVEFLTEDDRRCRVYMEEAEWPGRIRGVEDMDIMDIFDGMMFAG